MSWRNLPNLKTQNLSKSIILAKKNIKEKSTIFSPGTCVCGFWLMTKVWLPPHNSCFTEIIVSVKGFKNLDVLDGMGDGHASPLVVHGFPAKKKQLKSMAVFEQPEEFPYGPSSTWCKQTQERYHLGSCWHISKTSLSSAKMFWVRCSHQSQKTSVLVHHCITYIYCISIYIRILSFYNIAALNGKWHFSWAFHMYCKLSAQAQTRFATQH